MFISIGIRLARATALGVLTGVLVGLVAGLADGWLSWAMFLGGVAGGVTGLVAAVALSVHHALGTWHPTPRRNAVAIASGVAAGAVLAALTQAVHMVPPWSLLTPVVTCVLVAVGVFARSPIDDETSDRSRS